MQPRGDWRWNMLALTCSPTDLVVDLLGEFTCSEHAAETVLWPKLAKVLPDYPDIKVELFTEHSFTDIAAERFDAGVRLGQSVEKDMIAVRIGPDGRLVAVASPSHFRRHSLPETRRIW